MTNVLERVATYVEVGMTKQTLCPWCDKNWCEKPPCQSCKSETKHLLLGAAYGIGFDLFKERIKYWETINDK